MAAKATKIAGRTCGAENPRDEGRGTVGQVNDRLAERGRQWAYTTVQTLLNRLRAKQVVAVSKQDVAHVYRASVSRNELLTERLNELAGELCEGASAPLVVALVQGKRKQTGGTNTARDGIGGTTTQTYDPATGTWKSMLANFPARADLRARRALGGSNPLSTKPRRAPRARRQAIGSSTFVRSLTIRPSSWA
jgi:predicted transcriptional regulator